MSAMSLRAQPTITNKISLRWTPLAYPKSNRVNSEIAVNCLIQRYALWVNLGPLLKMRMQQMPLIRTEADCCRYLKPLTVSIKKRNCKAWLELLMTFAIMTWCSGATCSPKSLITVTVYSRMSLETYSLPSTRPNLATWNHRALVSASRPPKCLPTVCKVASRSKANLIAAPMSASVSNAATSPPSSSKTRSGILRTNWETSWVILR